MSWYNGHLIPYDSDHYCGWARYEDIVGGAGFTDRYSWRMIKDVNTDSFMFVSVNQNAFLYAPPIYGRDFKDKYWSSFAMPGNFNNNFMKEPGFDTFKFKLIPAGNNSFFMMCLAVGYNTEPGMQDLSYGRGHPVGTFFKEESTGKFVMSNYWFAESENTITTTDTWVYVQNEGIFKFEEHSYNGQRCVYIIREREETAVVGTKSYGGLEFPVFGTVIRKYYLTSNWNPPDPKWYNAVWGFILYPLNWGLGQITNLIDFLGNVPKPEAARLTLAAPNGSDNQLWKLVKNETDNSYSFICKAYNAVVYTNGSGVDCGASLMSFPSFDRYDPRFKFHIVKIDDWAIITSYDDFIYQKYNSYGDMVNYGNIKASDPSINSRITWANTDDCILGGPWSWGFGQWIEARWQFKFIISSTASGYVQIQHVGTGKLLTNQFKMPDCDAVCQVSSAAKSAIGVVGDFANNPLSFGFGVLTGIVDAFEDLIEFLVRQVFNQVPRQPIADAIKAAIETGLKNMPDLSARSAVKTRRRLRATATDNRHTRARRLLSPLSVMWGAAVSVLLLVALVVLMRA